MRILAVLSVAAALAGCGSQPKDTVPPATAPAAPAARALPDYRRPPYELMAVNRPLEYMVYDGIRPPVGIAEIYGQPNSDRTRAVSVIAIFRNGPVPHYAEWAVFDDAGLDMIVRSYRLKDGIWIFDRMKVIQLKGPVM